MAFTYDPSTDRGKVRRNIGDKDTDTAANQMFTDAEIDSFLDSASDNVEMASAVALRAMASDPELRAIRYRLVEGDIDIDKTKMAEMLLQAAEHWERQALQQSPTEEIDSFDYEVRSTGKQAGEFVGDI